MSEHLYIYGRRTYYEQLGVSGVTGYRYEQLGVLDGPDVAGGGGFPAGYRRDRVRVDQEKIAAYRNRRAA